jgi:hypothetical protein
MPILGSRGAGSASAFGLTSGGGVPIASVEYLVIAGGGAGGGYPPGGPSTSVGGGGGGAGGYRTGTDTDLVTLVEYSVVVGAGASGATPWPQPARGSDSTFNTTSSTGGGTGDGDTDGAEAGGSGGGATYGPVPGGAGNLGVIHLPKVTLEEIGIVQVVPSKQALVAAVLVVLEQIIQVV